MHWQAAALFLSVHRALDPHGEGLQGSMISVGTAAVVILVQNLNGSPVYPGSQVQTG